VPEARCDMRIDDAVDETLRRAELRTIAETAAAVWG
jgi:hypothetical protein